MTDRSRALIEVHVATLLYGFIAPLGKAVELDPYEIVFWRTSLAAVVIFVIARRLKSRSPIRSWNDLATFSAIAGPAFRPLGALLPIDQGLDRRNRPGDDVHLPGTDGVSREYFL